MAKTIADVERAVVDRFGSVVGEQAQQGRADAARNLLLTAFRAKRFQTRHLPERRQPGWGRIASRIALDDMVEPLTHPERAVLASIFMPTELFRAAGLLPYSAEALSGFMTAADAEQAFVTEAEGSGVAETYCSFHKALIGASELGVVQPPAFIASCSLACDANSLTFKTLGARLGVPHVFVDVPYEVSAEAVAYVADELREVAALMREQGHPVDETRLLSLVTDARASLDALVRSLPARCGRNLQNTMGQEMQAALALHLSLGRPMTRKMCEQMAPDLAAGRPFEGLSLVWMHVPPFFQEPLQRMLDDAGGAQIVASDMCFDAIGDPTGADAEAYDQALAARDPYAFMAARLVYNAFNGSGQRRIERALHLARATEADGVVCFCQWGCKHTLGLSQLAKERLEAEGFPTLVLEGDGCNRANTSNGQVETRMGAFLEMLRARRQEA